MTSKERMQIALRRGIPDRVPVSTHEWQKYHLDTYMNGMNDIEAFRYFGLDANIVCFPVIERESQSWKVTAVQTSKADAVEKRYSITTPEGDLSYTTGTNEITTWITEPLVKKDEDIQLIKKYKPVPALDKKQLSKKYDELGDDGLVRGHLYYIGGQIGCWQDACYLAGTEEMIMACFDKPEWVHEFLEILLQCKLDFIETEMRGAKYDIIETGGGASSNTIISPDIHREFCLPYDKRLHEALDREGFCISYHTCGGMTKILDYILENGCHVSETLSPPGVGGDITDPSVITDKFRGKLAMIGGLDQFNILTNGTAEQIKSEVRRLFDAYGKEGGYIMCPSDHFFDAPVENIKTYVQAAKECVY